MESDSGVIPLTPSLFDDSALRISVRGRRVLDVRFLPPFTNLPRHPFTGDRVRKSAAIGVFPPPAFCLDTILRRRNYHGQYGYPKFALDRC